MGPSANDGPVPWPLPPRLNSDGEWKEAEPASSDDEGADRGLPLQSLAERGGSRDSRGSTKLSPAVFQRISKLYPEPVGQVLTQDQVPAPREARTRDWVESQASICESGEREQFWVQSADEYSMKSSGSSSESVVNFVTFYGEDDGIDLAAALDSLAADSSDSLTGNSVCEQVPLSNSLRGLFKDDDDFLTPQYSAHQSATSDGASPPYTLGGNSGSGATSNAGLSGQGGRNFVPYKQETVVATKGNQQSTSESPVRRARRTARALESARGGHEDLGMRENSLHVEAPQATQDPDSTEEKQVLRRPLGSKRKTFVDLRNVEFAGEHTTMRQEVEEPEKEQPPAGNAERWSETVPNHPERNLGGGTKGVIMRTFSQHGYVKGIRRAETGLIMSRDEARANKDRNVPDNPIPKSLRPSLFLDDDDNVPSLSPASFQRSPGHDTFLEFKSPAKRSSSRKRDSRAFRSITSMRQSARSSNSNSEEMTLGSSGSQEQAGFVARLGAGIKKAAFTFGRKSSGASDDAAQNDILICGTIDEAVCQISHICRKSLKYEVVVKDAGRKIKVGSTDASSGGYLRATLLLRTMPGNEAMCAVHIRQSRSGGTKTTIATLWLFYQKLNDELRKWSQLSVPAGSLFARSP